MRKFTALIVDDDADIRDLHESSCHLAIAEVKEENNLQLDSQIMVAPELDKAIDLFTHNDVSFVSLDLALKKNEEGLSDEERRQGVKAGGMVFLNTVDVSDANIIIVSGEKSISYAVESLKDFGVLAFYEKSKFDQEEYRKAVKCFVYYHCARDLILNRANPSGVTKGELDLAEKYIRQGVSLGNTAHVNCDKFTILKLKAIELRNALNFG